MSLNTNWTDIVFELLDDPMIQSCGCDGLLDAHNALKGLFAMDELFMGKLDKDFVLEVINKSIDARNRYTWMNGWKKIPHVNEKFEWEE